jgi:hypothetical protein
MFANAWQRELGGKLRPKIHLIDSLVLTTRDMREERIRLLRENRELRERLDQLETTQSAAESV